MIETVLRMDEPAEPAGPADPNLPRPQKLDGTDLLIFMFYCYIPI